jgi:hypothetical protein
VDYGLASSFSGEERKRVQDLFQGGIPDSLIWRFKRARRLTVAFASPSRRVVCFGESGLAGSVCLDPVDGRVVVLSNLEPPAPLILVNSSLRQLRETAKAMVHRFPYCSESDGPKYVEGVQADLRAIVVSLDPPALDGFWGEMISDVGVGDLATEYFDPRPDE